MKLLIFFIILIFTEVSAQNIATINILFILDNNIQYQKFLELLNNKKKLIQKDITNQENRLELLQEEIERSKLILNDQSLKKELDKYNENLKIYQLSIDNFNNFVEENILYNKKIIINKIALITTEYSKINDINLVINANNYFVSSKDIDISEIILKSLSNHDINFKILNENDY